jgi:tetratricopeptide (TPR) repeat protein
LRHAPAFRAVRAPWTRSALRLAGIGLALAVAAGACAPRSLPAAPEAPRHPDFVYPAVPPGFNDPGLLRRHESGWRYLQFDNLRAAEREFDAALRAQPSFYPAEAALGWVALARSNASEASAHFARALEADEAYVPGLVGLGHALLELEQDADALAAFERALQGDPGLTAVARRVEVLRFRTLQTRLEAASAAAREGRWDEARAAYLAAIAASPDSAFLYRELASVERRSGRPDDALVHARHAVTLEPGDAAGHLLVAELLEGRGDYDDALEAYGRARTIDSSPAVERAWASARERAEFARMPVPYREIPQTTVITRGSLAALIGVRLQMVVARAPARQVVVTDVRDHWAATWIMEAARTGVIEAFPNYTFQPDAPVRRGDLAVVVSRILSLLAEERPAFSAAWQGARPAVADVLPGHLSYPAVALAVASGVMPLDGQNRFRLLDAVSGAEAVAVVDRLEALARR